MGVWRTVRRQGLIKNTNKKKKPLLVLTGVVQLASTRACAVGPRLSYTLAHPLFTLRRSARDEAGKREQGHVNLESKQEARHAPWILSVFKKKKSEKKIDAIVEMQIWRLLIVPFSTPPPRYTRCYGLAHAYILRSVASHLSLFSGTFWLPWRFHRPCDNRYFYIKLRESNCRLKERKKKKKNSKRHNWRVPPITGYKMV